MTRSPAGERWRAAKAILMWDLRRRLLDFSPYLIVVVASVVSSLILGSGLQYAADKGVAVLNTPAIAPFQIFLVVSGLYNAFGASLSVTRERDSGTLEVLFYGPVDDYSYILGKFGAFTLVQASMSALFSLYVSVYSTTMNLNLNVSIAGAFFLSVLCSGILIALAVSVGSLSSSVRSSLLILIGVSAIFLSLQMADEALAWIAVPERYFDPYVLLRTALRFVNTLMAWVSPLSYFADGLHSIYSGSVRELSGVILRSLTLIGLFISIGVWGLTWRGISK